MLLLLVSHKMSAQVSWYIFTFKRILLVDKFYIQISGDSGIVEQFNEFNGVMTQRIVDTLTINRDGIFEGKCFKINPKKGLSVIQLTSNKNCYGKLNSKIEREENFNIEELWYNKNRVLLDHCPLNKINLSDQEKLSKLLKSNPIYFSEELNKLITTD